MRLPEDPLDLAWPILAALLQTFGFLVILAGIRRSVIRPNPFSWLIWSLVAGLAAIGSWRAGATWPLAGAIANALGCIAVLIATLRKGSIAIDRIDLSCLCAALTGIVAWYWTDDPVIGLALFLTADAVGALPTIRTVALDPRSESLAGWTLLALAGIAAVLSVEAVQWQRNWTGFGHWGGAVYVAAVNVLVASVILLARVFGRVAVVRLRAASPE
jgi:hypothetical protein